MRIAIDSVELAAASVARLLLVSIAHYFPQWTFRLPRILPFSSEQPNAINDHHHHHTRFLLQANSIISISCGHTDGYYYENENVRWQCARTHTHTQHTHVPSVASRRTVGLHKCISLSSKPFES